MAPVLAVVSVVAGLVPATQRGDCGGHLNSPIR
jgi:hypothetical protein